MNRKIPPGSYSYHSAPKPTFEDDEDEDDEPEVSQEISPGFAFGYSYLENGHGVAKYQYDEDSERDYRYYKFYGRDIAEWIRSHVPNATTTHSVATYLRANNLYIAKELAKSGKVFTTEDAYVAVTYPWSANLLQILDFLESDLIWIDIVNINQNAKDIKNELSVLYGIYKDPGTHAIFGLESFTRGWCLFEIAVANEERWKNDLYGSATSIVFQAGSKSLDKDPQFDDSNFSVESDRQAVKKAVRKRYGDTAEFDKLILSVMQRIVS